MDYSTDNGSSWTSITSYYNTTSESYSWTVPNTSSGICLIRITDSNNSGTSDISDAVFTITSPLTVSTPNGGETWEGSTAESITFTKNGTSNYYDISYSTDAGGSNWTNIAFNQNITSDSYPWTVPGSVSQNCLIKVTDNVNTCKTDMSNQVFAIGTAAIDITVDAPAGGEVWNGCTTQTINWTSIGTSNDYDLAYSIDGGANWTSIEDDYNTTLNTYDWTIPNENSANCLIRVRDANNTNFYGISPTEFEIASVIADAGENFALCMGGSQQLSTNGGVTYAWLPTNGLSDPNIANPIANPTSTTTYTVFVTDANGCTDSDEITITVNPIPASPVAGSNSPVPLNGTLELTASTVAFANYTWTGPNGYTSNLQNPEINNANSALDGTYEVTAIVYGCESAPASTAVTVSGTPSSIILNGAVITENNSPVNGVSLNLTGDLSNSFTTNPDGLYSFAVDNGGAYEIAASKNNDVTTNNGVSTLDIILMQRHILGVQALSSPYKIIAADVNRSESVSTLDILYTRALILQTSNSLPGGDLWTFVNSDYVFPDAQNPFPYEQTRLYSSATELADQNFTGIKLGDVNNSWNNNIAKSGTENLNFRIDNNNSSFGEVIEIPVYADNFNNISGFQMSIEWAENKLEFVEIDNQAIELFFNSNHLNNGMLSCLWSTENANGFDIDSDDVLFTMKFEIISDLNETASISFNSVLTESEAYNHELDIMNIQLDGGDIILNNYLYLNENEMSTVLNAYPNPFRESTRLVFYLPKAAKVNFKLYSITGKCLWTYSQNYMSGKHSYDFNGRNKQGEKLSPGTYILRFRANNTLKNHKLIIQ
ncbi:MAG: T9SS type A sorting domain-containing protein [Bacteroidota bacterium]|nr:T9SS type A sorting domain-containing protein [Bacteroidota bacterium]